MTRKIISPTGQNVDIAPGGAGLLTIKGTVGIDAIIDDNTMATASATNIASSLSIRNYVDAKFETGTFAPTITFQTPGDLNVAYLSRAGSYTRIITPTRRIVFFTLEINTSTFTFSTSSGDVRFGGLPFNGINTYFGSVHIRQTANFSWGNNATYLSGVVPSGGNYFTLTAKINNGNFAGVTTTNFTTGNTPSMNASGWYYSS